MTPGQFNGYLVSTVYTDGLVLQHQASAAEYASMLFQLFISLSPGSRVIPYFLNNTNYL